MKIQRITPQNRERITAFIRKEASIWRGCIGMQWRPQEK